MGTVQLGQYPEYQGEVPKRSGSLMKGRELEELGGQSWVLGILGAG